MENKNQKHMQPRSIDAIADRLLRTRLALGIDSQKAFAEGADLAPNTYNQWEKAKGRPDLDGALKLCTAYDITLDWIYTGDMRGLPHGLAQTIREQSLKAS